MKIPIITTTIIFVFISCSLSSSKTDDEKLNKIDKEKQQVISKVVSKYNIKFKFDTLNYREYKYTIDFNPVINSQFQLIDDFEIADIFEKDSLEFVSIKTGIVPVFHFTLPITKGQEQALMNDNDDLILVVSVSSLKKIMLSIEGECDENKNATVNFENSDDYIGQGKIVEILSLKRKD